MFYNVPRAGPVASRPVTPGVGLFVALRAWADPAWLIHVE